MSNLISNDLKELVMDDILTDFVLFPEVIPLLEKYYLLRWSGEYFSREYYRSSGRLIHQTISYQIIFDPHQSVREILSANRIEISFRKFKDSPLGYAMVRSCE